MARKLNNFKSLTPFVFRSIVCILILFYLFSCSDTAVSSPSPSPSATLPGQVGGLVVSDPSYDGVNNQGGFTVSWTAPTNTGLTADGQAATITGYEVAYAEMVGEEPGEYTTAEGTNTSFTFTGLETNTQYDIRIQAQTAAGAGDGNHISGWVPSLPGAVDRGLILLTNATSNTIDIAWTAPQAGRAGGSSSTNATTWYKVEVSNVGEGTYNTVVEDYFGTVITVTNLKELTTYHARITAENIWGEAEPSVSTNTGTTLAPPTPPSMVSNLEVDSFSYDRVVLSWEGPTNTGTTYGTTVATLIGYVVKYTETVVSNFVEISETGDEGVRLSVALKGDSTNATVIGLDGGTSYTFLVVAVNSANAVGLDRDAPTVEHTTSLAPPRNLRKATCAKTTSVNLAWDASTGATSYKLYRNGTEISDVTGTSYTDTGLTAGTQYTYTVEACTDAGCSAKSQQSLTITTQSENEKSLKSIIELGQIPADLSSYDQRYQDIFSRYTGRSALVARYLDPDGTGDGTSFANAAGNLRSVLEGITDASASQVYAVLLTGGNYKAGGEMAMKNHVAIIGGVDECLDSSTTVTELDGEGSYRVFNNDQNDLNNTALLYGVTVTNGKTTNNGGGMYNYSSSPRLEGVTFSGNTANNGGGMYNLYSSPTLNGVTFSENTANNGGGMYNWEFSPRLEGVTFSGNTANNGGGMYNLYSSPTLNGVTFSENTANNVGGGMHNRGSSPILERVTFSGNTATFNGGGMANHYSSSPSLEGVTFSENTANDRGGGMYNGSSSPSLVGVTFSGNKANNHGGGMYNHNSSPSLEGVTFSENTAEYHGGGMYNKIKSSPSLVGVTFFGNEATSGRGGGMYNESSSSPTIINGIFWGNTTSSGPEFSISNNSTIGIFNSIVEGGATGTGITSANITTTDPGLGELADNGGSVLTHAIESNSPAVNQGLYVKKSGDTLYYSDDNTDWYNSPDLSGTAVTPPADAEDLTATDATGYDRTNRPDLGAYEYR